MLNPLGRSNDILFCNNFNDKKCILLNKEDFFTPKEIISLKNDLFSRENSKLS